MKRDDTEKRAKVKVIQFDQHQHALTELEQHCETFADVGGLEDIKKKINMDFILPLQNPEYFKAFGKATGEVFFCLARRDAAKHLSRKRLPARSKQTLYTWSFKRYCPCMLGRVNIICMIFLKKRVITVLAFFLLMSLIRSGESAGNEPAS